jgi:hypothetical protein
VTAISANSGVNWKFKGEALALNPYCPWFDTDSDNQESSSNRCVFIVSSHGGIVFETSVR